MIKKVRDLFGIPRSIWVLLTATLINRSGSMALLFLVIYLTQNLKVSTARAGSIVAIYGIGAFITAPLAGKLCDRLGKLRLMKSSLLLSGVAMLIFTQAESFYALVVLTIAWAIASEAFRPASLAIMTDLAGPEQRKAVFALNRLAINLGLSLGPAVGGFLIIFSYRILFWIDGITSILAGLFLILAFKEAKSDGAPAATNKASNRPSLITILPEGRLLFLLLATLPALMVFFQNRAALALFVTEGLRLPASSYGLLFTINTLLIIFFEVPLNTWMGGWAHRYTLALGSILLGAGFGSMIFVSGFRGLAATVVFWTVGEMIFLPSVTTYVAEISPPSQRGEFMGFFSMTMNMALCLGPWLGTVVIESYGFQILWAGAFIFALLSALMFWLITARNNQAYGLSSIVNADAKQSC
jgi:predicted MFS family arabinose efflux permease